MCRAKDQGETKEEPRNDQRTPKLKKVLLLRLPSLLPLLYLALFHRENSERRPTDDRETTDSTPHYPKVLFIKIAFLKMLTPFLKKLTKVLK